MPIRWILLLAPALACAADWNPRAAADYLDGRQQEWFAWPGAKIHADPCVSCHGGLPYLLARPALRRVLHETGPTRYETGLLASLRDRVPLRSPLDLYPKRTEAHRAEAAGVESIFAAFFLRTPEAVSRMRTLQTDSGAYPWFNLNEEPWEQPKSAYFGAALAYLADPNDRLRAYLVRAFDGEPMHHQIIGIWSGAIQPQQRAAALEKLWRAQASDGSWTLDALGPWVRQPGAPPTEGPSTYATAFTAAVLQNAGVPRSDPHVARTLDWLRNHQSVHGYWYAVSMNKEYPAGSMPYGFMRDAATGWAVLALCGVQ